MKNLIVATLVLEACLFSGSPVSAQEQAPPPPPPPPPAATTPAPAPATVAQPVYTPPPPAAPVASPDAGSGNIRDNTIDHRPMSLSILGWLPWFQGFGFGAMARFEIPIVHNGFISSLNNHVSLEPAFGFSYSTYGLHDVNYINFTPALYGTWSFHFSPEFHVYGGIGLGWNIGNDTGDHDFIVDSNSYFYFDGCVGLYYNVASALSLRAEVGSGGPKAGIALLF